MSETKRWHFFVLVSDRYLTIGDQCQFVLFDDVILKKLMYEAF